MSKLKITLIAIVILSVVAASSFIYISNRNLERKVLELSQRNKELDLKISAINRTIIDINTSIDANLAKYYTIQPEINNIYNSIDKLKLANKDIASKLDSATDDYNKRNDTIDTTESSKEDMCKRRAAVGYPCK